MANILIIEDDLALQSQIKRFLESRGLTVDTASDGWDGIEALRSSGCDILVLDIRLPGLIGTDVMKKIAEVFMTPPPIIIITGHGDKSLAIESLRWGVCDFLEKPFDPSRLVDTIDRIYRDKKDQIQAFQQEFSGYGATNLSTRENEIARLVAHGLSNDEVAKKLHISVETVKSHLKHIFQKLNVSNRTELSRKVS